MWTQLFLFVGLCSAVPWTPSNPEHTKQATCDFINTQDNPSPRNESCWASCCDIQVLGPQNVSCFWLEYYMHENNGTIPSEFNSTRIIDHSEYCDHEFGHVLLAIGVFILAISLSVIGYYVLRSSWERMTCCHSRFIAL